jgi:hypothetical protein
MSLALAWGPAPPDCGYYRNEGGKSSKNIDQVGKVGAVFGVFSFESHSRLSFTSGLHGPYLVNHFLPLLTTSYA